MNISVIQVWDENQDALAVYTASSVRDYCRRHAYNDAGVRPYHVAQEHEDGLPLSYAKQQVAFNNWGHNHWFALLDSDVFVTNSDFDLAKWLAKIPESVDFVGCRDIRGFNAGVFFLRCTHWAYDLLVKSRQAWPLVKDVCGGWGNQIPLLMTLACEPQHKWRIMPQRPCNGYLYEMYGMDCSDGQWQPGDFLLHLPGLSTGDRIKALKDKGLV